MSHSLAIFLQVKWLFDRVTSGLSGKLRNTRLDTLVSLSLDERRVSSTQRLERLAQWRMQAVSLEAHEIYSCVSGSSTHKHLSIKYYKRRA